MAKYKYSLYDTREQKQLDGEFTAGEVQKITGCRSDVASYAHDGHLINQRYTVKIVKVEAEEHSHKENDKRWAREWDKARLKLLRLKKQ